MDLVEYAEATFRGVESSYRVIADELGLEQVVCIPVSGLRATTSSTRSEQMPWYAGPTLLEYLEAVEVEEGRMRAGRFASRCSG